MDKYLIGWTLLAAVACGRTPSQTPEPEARTKEQAHGTVEHTYQEGQPRPAKAKAPPAALPSGEPVAVPDRRTAVALIEAAVDESLEPDAQRLISPLIPASWPPTDDTVVSVVYPLTPVEEEALELRIGTAVLIVRVQLRSGEVRTEKIAPTKRKLGTRVFERDPSLETTIRDSERALVNVLLGGLAVEKSGSSLRGYQLWMDRHPYISAPLRAHAHAFFDFVAAQR